MSVFRLFVFFIFFTSCNNSINIDFFNSKNSTFIIKKSEKKYTLKKPLIIPKNKTLIIENGVEIDIKKNGKIINNGVLIFGEKNKTDSLYFYIEDELKSYYFYYDIKIYSNKGSYVYSKKNSNIIINNSFFKNIFIESSDININSSFFLNSKINSDSSFIKINNSFFKNIDLNINNGSFNLNNSVFVKNKNSFYIKNSNQPIVNNCLLLKSSGFVFINSNNGSLLNNVFYDNENSIIINNYNGYLKLYNNIFLNNNIVINNKDTCQLYILNNTVDNNNIFFKSDLKKNKKHIISKNNIFSYNDIIYKINNVNISNSYCLSNTDSLIGYFNIFKNPLYVDNKNFNFNLKESSEALGLGNNNSNIGANIKHIYNIKYLK